MPSDVEIVGALINPKRNDVGGELVTVLNTSSAALDLTGWKILDKNDRAELLDGKIPVGEARTFRLRGTGAQLSNEGGTITLLDATGLKVDGVAHTKADAARLTASPTPRQMRRGRVQRSRFERFWHIPARWPQTNAS